MSTSPCTLGGWRLAPVAAGGGRQKLGGVIFIHFPGCERSEVGLKRTNASLSEDSLKRG